MAHHGWSSFCGWESYTCKVLFNAILDTVTAQHCCTCPTVIHILLLYPYSGFILKANTVTDVNPPSNSVDWVCKGCSYYPIEPLRIEHWSGIHPDWI
jgi:hypothetical protein